MNRDKIDELLADFRRELGKMQRERSVLDAAILRVEDALRLLEGDGAPALTIAFRRKPHWTATARAAARKRVQARWALVRKVGGRSLADIPPPRTTPRSRR